MTIKRDILLNKLIQAENHNLIKIMPFLLDPRSLETL